MKGFFFGTFIIIIASMVTLVSSDKKPGTINDLFTHEDSEFHSQTFLELKSKIREEYPQLERENAEKLLRKLERKLLKQLDAIQDKGTKRVLNAFFIKVLVLVTLKYCINSFFSTKKNLIWKEF